MKRSLSATLSGIMRLGGVIAIGLRLILDHVNQYLMKALDDKALSLYRLYPEDALRGHQLALRMPLSVR